MPKTKQAVEQAAKLKIYIPQLDRLEKKLLEWTEKEKFQACVVKATRYGVPIFEGCYGESANDSGVKMDTIFPVASNTKPIIATLLMILQEEGQLDLGENMYRFIPEFHGGGRENICPWHFLTHTSGIVDAELYKSVDEYIRDELNIENLKDDATEEDRLDYNEKIKKALELPEDYDWHKTWRAISLKVKLNHTPRELMSYSSYGYNMLKDVICAVTGESIDSYAQRALFNPLGMVDSHWILPKEKWGRVVGRDERCLGYGWANSERCYTSESGGGGLKTTVADMSRFCEMILGKGRYNNKRILSPASVREMTKNYNSNFENPFDAWGLGWNYRGTKVDDLGILRSANAVDHSGWGSHKIVLEPDHDLVVIIYMAECNWPNEFWFWGRVSNMFIAACE